MAAELTSTDIGSASSIPENDTIPDHEIKLSKLAYTPALLRKQALLSDPELAHFQLLPEYNDDEFFSVYNPQDGYVYNVHRGSATLHDFGVTDVELALGRFEQTKRYKNSFAKSAYMKERYGNVHRMKELGHSLGGTLADEIGFRLHHESAAFNPGTSPFWKPAKKDRSINKVYRTHVDPVSGYDNVNAPTKVKRSKNYFGRTHILGWEALQRYWSHSLDSF